MFSIGGYGAPGWDVVEYYDTTTPGWTPGPSLPTPRYGLVAEAINNSIYAIGGVGWHIPATNLVEVLDTTTMTWSTGAPMQLCRAYAVRGRVLLTGMDGVCVLCD